MGCAQGFLFFMNAITLILGGCMLGFSIYAVVTFKDGWDTFVTLSAVYAGIAAGVFMILVSILGCFAAKENSNKCTVFVYFILVTLILGLQIGAAVVIMQYSGTISDQNGLVSADMISSASIALNNGILSTYTSCCSGCPPSAGCNNTQAYFADKVVDNCLNQGLTCDQVTQCSGSVQDDCYVFAPSDKVLLPPINIDFTMCTLLTNLHQNGSAIVGPANTGSCGHGSSAAFSENMNNYFSASFFWVAIAFCVIAGLQALIILASLYILCCVTRKYHDYK